jgi:hypothetical protein
MTVRLQAPSTIEYRFPGLGKHRVSFDEDYQKLLSHNREVLSRPESALNFERVELHVEFGLEQNKLSFQFKVE